MSKNSYFYDMLEKAEALHGEYVIDGVREELSPARMLNSLCSAPQAAEFPADPIIDETPEPAAARLLEFDDAQIGTYLAKVMALGPRNHAFPMAFSAPYTRLLIAQALIDTLWKRGHFRLGDLALSMEWKWNSDALGNMAAFYRSAQSAADYIDSLGLRLSHYSYQPSKTSHIEISTPLFRSLGEDDDPLEKLPFHSGNPWLSGSREQPNTLVHDPKSWIIYIPFESCDYRLGGSALAQTLDFAGGTAPEISDADYFLDCYEVIRELVEDGILLAGETVGAGGLMAALRKMCGFRTGAEIDLGDLMRATGEKDRTRLLFSEVPGALIQLRDSDYDYLDAELLLQDVSYYPLGHVRPGGGIDVLSSEKNGLQTILESLIQKSSEGED